MASGGTLCWCRCRWSPSLFVCNGNSVSWSSWARLPSISNETAYSCCTFPSSSPCGSFGSVRGWVAQYSGLMSLSLSGIRLLNYLAGEFDLAVGERIASYKASYCLSVPSIGYAGLCWATFWTSRLFANFTRRHEMQMLISSNFSHQAQGAGQGLKTRTAPRRWRLNCTEPFSSSATGVDLALKHRFPQWHGDQNGPIWMPSRRVSLALQLQDNRNLVISATRQVYRCRPEVPAESISDLEHTGVVDLDFYMNSQYDQENLKSNQSDLGTVQSEVAEENLLGDLKQNDKGKFDNVVAVLGDPRVLSAARDRLRKGRWNWSAASNELEVSHVPEENKLLRLQEIDHNWFREAAYQLRSGSYSFKPAISLQIARRGREAARLRVFVRPKDQVIQEAIRGILEGIYRHSISIYDSGSYTNVHSALKSVKYGWNKISWFLQFDASTADSGTVEKRLLKLLAEQIEDDVFLDVLRQMLKLGIVWIGTKADDYEPEGSVLSPMLRNIYFYHLDLEISRMKEDIKNGSQA